MQKLAGKVALVSGAGQGLGLAIARAFLGEGASVVLADINPGVTEIAREADPSGRRAIGFVMDVSHEDQWTVALATTVDRFGALDILVNNAALTISKSVWDIPQAEWDDVMAVNLRGVFFGCRVAGRHMRDRKSGRIINLSSLAGQRGGVVAGAHYSASKAGIRNPSTLIPESSKTTCKKLEGTDSCKGGAFNAPRRRPCREAIRIWF